MGPLCNICGGAEFEAGPGGRAAESGSGLPRCASCGSLERHRGLRRAFQYVPPSTLNWRRAIQFAPDGSLEESWFRSWEGSTYGGENSIDLQQIDRPDGSYDFVSLSAVMEFVRDDRKAFSELLRIGSDELILHLTVMPGLTGQTSSHFDQAKGWGTWHDYGWDFEEWFGTAEQELSVLVFDMPDPVTGDATCPFCFFFRRRPDAETWAAMLDEAPEATIRRYNPA